MNQLNRRILAECIARQVGKFDHPVCAIDVTDKHVYIITTEPGKPEGECVRYRHNFTDADAQAVTGDTHIELTVSDEPFTDEEPGLDNVLIVSQPH